MLYERHAGAARALARQYVSPADADDVVADAFSKLFEMLRRGAGPDAGFRPYLYTVVRHRSFDVSRGAARMRPSTDDEIESVVGRVASDEDPALAGFERSVVSKAYFDLPERWREVLWYVLVDDLKPAQVAPVLGLSPNGVSALLYRAKEALRAGYLQQHLTHAPSDMCRSVNPLLGGYVRDSLSKRETTKIADHLETCGTCSALVLELHDVAHGMKTVIAPLVLGAGGLALVGAGAPIGGIFVAAKAGAGAAVGSAPAATATVGVASTGTFSGAVSSAVSATAGAFAAATGGSVAAGAIAVATVSMVAALQIAGPSDPEPVANDSVISTADGRGLPGTEEINGKPVSPSDTDIEPDPSTQAVLRVDYTDASSPLAPREHQILGFTITNAGEVAATGTQLELTLPPGLTMTPHEGPFGTGVGGRLVQDTAEPTEGPDDTGTQTPEADSGESSAAGTGSDPESVPDGETQAEPSASPSAPATVGPLPNDGPIACNPTEQANVLLCTLGEVAPAQAHRVEVPVRANAGGDYPIGAEVWADGLDHVTIDLADRAVASFGPELSASTDNVSLGSPGTAALPIRLNSTGDRTVPADWGVVVSLPGGVRPAETQPELSCTAMESSRAWFCAPRAGTDGATAVEPGDARAVALNVTSVVDASSAEATELGVANIRPVVTGGSAYSTTATVTVTSAWAKAADGVGTVAASCLAEGGTGTADAVVTGAYTNTTQRTVRVALQAAGTSASTGKSLAPGESIELTVHDGLRLPAGQAVFVLATDVDGQTYKTPVPAGDHQAVDCYKPSWSTEVSARTMNTGGTVTVEGKVTNTSDETMRVDMVVTVDGTAMKSVSLPVTPGGTQTLTVDTGSAMVPEGEAVFRLAREGKDEDGDVPARAVVSEDNPTAHYGAATIAPALGDRPVIAGACEFDAEQDRSVQKFAFTADNTRSTLPVRFHVGDVTRTVEAGQTQVIEYPVAWGTETSEITAGGKVLDTTNVSFESCAELKWPGEAVTVGTATQCSADSQVQLTATVDNRTGRDWTGTLVRESSNEIGADQPVPAGQPTTLALTRQTPISTEGSVTVRLYRQLEGRTHEVEWSYGVRGQNCIGAECEPTLDANPAALGRSETSAVPRTENRWPWHGFDTCMGEPADQA
ncbi:sigma-70 family RNA polymerase sigma factor [Promicromonospora sp. CA-289599]|uniref:sigma-70 family RNA polymerase sigma factor n=1 Tax=Promicromonospora sp. CA-289599 TaxID=3240014 RepID=UPI003D94A43D